MEPTHELTRDVTELTRDATEPARDAIEPARWCDRCGGALAGADHGACASARQLEPPRFCPRCRRRMKVQVLPVGWSATCVEHGTSAA